MEVDQQLSTRLVELAPEDLIVCEPQIIPANTTQPFAPIKAIDVGDSAKDQYRRITVPPNRLTPLKQQWPKIYRPLVEHLKLQVRFNLKTKHVELRTSPQVEDIGAVQKGADFIKAFTLGFEVDDALVLLRVDDVYLDTFEIKDVKTLNGDHLARAIGRLAGKNGKTKHAIENASRTRIVLADSTIHILGAYRNIRIAKDAMVNLIRGSTPGKVYTQLRSVSARLVERNI